MATARSSFAAPAMSPALVPLEELGADQAGRAGAKATRLAALARAGFPVPRGVVLLADLAPAADLEALAAEALAALRAGAVAVRSSAIAEDLADASFAGQYETVLEVRGAPAVAAAIRHCLASATSARAGAYRPGAGAEGAGRMAILIQEMVASEAAGVAFTAHPVTGDRGQTVVSAVRGLGERLVAGEDAGEQWSVVAGRAERAATGEAVLTAEQARAVAELARRVEAHFGGAPQDLEWAFADGALHLLQARPITALPATPSWAPPIPGGWMRHFRLGELLPEPVTPLFASWAIERIEERFWQEQARICGMRVKKPLHVLVNGWYFHSPFGAGGPHHLVGILLRQPRFLIGMLAGPSRPELLDRWYIDRLAREYEERILPRYRALRVDAEAQVDRAAPPELNTLVDGITDLAGEYLFSISLVAGYAWKTEGPLAAFHRAHLHAQLGGSHQTLLCGLAPPEPLGSHAIESLDWFRPTLGERGLPQPPPDPARHARIEAERRRYEAACRDALAKAPKRLARFEVLLALAQKYARIRERQLALLSLGWPVLRRAIARIGRRLCAEGVIARPEDVHFLERAELDAGVSLAAAVAARRRAWESNRRLDAPLFAGELPSFMKKMMVATVEQMRAPPAGGAAGDGDDALTGMPASPGRATGAVRVLTGVHEFGRLQPGEILVAPATTPVWTPLFARAAAVVTDGGNVAAHASLIAREYGIPAVVGARDATRRLHDGQLVTVDGSSGRILVHGAAVAAPPPPAAARPAVR